MHLYEQKDFFELLCGSYRRIVGKDLVPRVLTQREAVRWLYEDAPFGLLAHDTATDPVFVYGNKSAQRRFEYSWEELTALPSRLSAEAPERQARENFLQRVAERGYVDDYEGIRISKSGKRFPIADVTVWQLIDVDGTIRGQAARLP
ncbi:MEKHLA domain-containing protein [Rhizobium sp. SIMBA_035]